MNNVCRPIFSHESDYLGLVLGYAYEYEYESYDITTMIGIAIGIDIATL